MCLRAQPLRGRSKLIITIPNQHTAAFLDDRRPASRRRRQAITTHIRKPATITSRSIPIEFPQQRFRSGARTTTVRRPIPCSFTVRSERPQDHQHPQPGSYAIRARWSSRRSTRGPVRAAALRSAWRSSRWWSWCRSWGRTSSHDRRILEVRARRPGGGWKGRPRTVFPRGRSWTWPRRRWPWPWPWRREDGQEGQQKEGLRR
ncbi:MAG: hypothetical protein JWP34_4776 [Massilia sp.]|nr:hypothetical protein [Massilia sp.]